MPQTKLSPKTPMISVATRPDADAFSIRQAVADRVALGPNLLLETADLTGSRSSRSMLAFAPLAYARCTDRTVTITAGASPNGSDRALHTAGCALIEEVVTKLARYVDSFVEDAARLTFPRSRALDEDQRLREPNPLDALRVMAGFARQLAGAKLQEDPSHFPVLCGGFGFDFLDSFEDLPRVDKDQEFGDFEFMVPSRIIALDHLGGRTQITALTDPADGELEELAQIVQAVARDEGVAENARNTANASAATTPAGAASAGITKTDTLAPDAGNNAPTPAPQRLVIAQATSSDQEFRSYVQQMQQHIAAGDIYQVVPSRGFRIPCPDPKTAYRALRDLNPSPYMFYFETGRETVFGASPESCLTFRADSRDVRMHPIAGTRPRRRDRGHYSHENDSRTELSLRLDAKETSEHVMLVDLARNDLARIAKPGTRRVPQLLDVEHYSHVSHLVSTVSATLADGLDALDAYRACMNMGTLTGAPKIEATRLLRQVEGHGRGAYGGAIGYLAADGSFDSCIVIRSGVVKDGVATVRAGAGIVAASDPQSEADETCYKASAVLAAIARSQGAKLEVSR